MTLREHDRLRARELDERGAVELGAVLERLELAQRAEQPPVGLAAAVPDRVEQLGQRGVGLDRQRLGGAHVGHPGRHVLARDADEVRAVVDAQPVGVDLVEQVAGLARVEPLADHRLVADGQADEHVEVLGALAARRGRQQPAVGGGAEAHHRRGEQHPTLGRAFLVGALHYALDRWLALPRGGAVQEPVADVRGIQPPARARGKQRKLWPMAVTLGGGQGCDVDS